MAHGNMYVGLFGVPLIATFDLGADVWSRGQRNRFNVSVDQQRLLELARRKEVGELIGIRSKLDSLGLLKATLFRSWKSASDRLESERARAALPNAPALPSDSIGLTVPNLPDTAMPLAVGLDTNVQLPDMSIPGHDMDSMQAVVESRAQALDDMQATIDHLQREEERLSALVTARQKNKVLDLVASVRRFGIGTCAPNHSLFLINGLSMQGVTLELARNDLYLAFDHGRSFDDAWRNSDPNSDRLRNLQEALFFQDPKDVASRKLTALKIGVGEPERTHFHIGMLRATRDALPYGVVAGGGEVATELNHVVEVDAGLQVKEGHNLRFTLGRSLLRRSGAEGESAEGLGALMDRKAQHNQAIQLSWASKFRKTGTDVVLTGRVIDPLFNSLGMGFVRNGSRSVEATGGQSFSGKLRVRGGYKFERRESIGGSTATTDMDRWRLQTQFRPRRWLTLRAAYMPVRITSRTEGSGATFQRTEMIQGGVELSKRWHHNHMVLTMDGSRYAASRNAEGIATDPTWYFSGAGTVTVGDRWQFGATLGAFLDEQDSLGSGPIAATMQLGYRSKEDLEVRMELNGTVDEASALGWSAMIKRSISKRFYATLAAAHIVRPELYVLDGFEMSSVDNYNCTASIGFKW